MEDRYGQIRNNPFMFSIFIGSHGYQLLELLYQLLSKLRPREERKQVTIITITDIVPNKEARVL